MNDDVRRWLRRHFGHPESPPTDGANLDTVDERLDSLERRQREIHARLRLLERQSDPRSLRDDK